MSMITTKASELFRADLFCIRKPSFVTAKATVKRKVIDLLTGHYGFSKEIMQRFEEPAEAPINSRIVIAYTKDEPLVLKRLELGKGEPSKIKQIEYRLELVTKLREEKHIPFPKVIPSADGKFTVSQDGFLYYLMCFENGGAHYPHKDRRDICAAADTIGKLYGALRQLRNTFALPQRRYFEPDEIKIVERLQKAAMERKLKPRVRPYWEAFQKQYEPAYKEFLKQGWAQHQPEICHIDLHPHNLLLRNGKVAGVLDYESILFGNRIACLGFSIFKLLRNYTVLTKASPAAVTQLRENFIEKLIQNKALDPDEASSLSLGARVENIKRFLYGFRDQAEDNFRGGPRMPIFGRALSGEIEYVFDEAKSL